MAKKHIPEKFDKESFFIAWGLAIVCGGIGMLIIWATKTAPEGASKPMDDTTAQWLARMLPETTKETLAFIMGSLFLLFAVFCIFLGLKLVVQYIADKLQN